MDICSQEEASYYINAEGGMDLYDRGDFSQAGITLTFLKSVVRPYDQNCFGFVPHLSIIDVLMFNSPQSVLNMISNDYEEV